MSQNDKDSSNNSSRKIYLVACTPGIANDNCTRPICIQIPNNEAGTDATNYGSFQS